MHCGWLREIIIEAKLMHCVLVYVARWWPLCGEMAAKRLESRSMGLKLNNLIVGAMVKIIVFNKRSGRAVMVINTCVDEGKSHKVS